MEIPVITYSLYGNEDLDLKSASKTTSTQALAQGSYSSYFSNLNNCDDRKSPKLIWKSDPKNLIRNSANFLVQVISSWKLIVPKFILKYQFFETKYLGSSALIKTNPNQDPVKQTIDRLKTTAKSTPYQLPRVELAVSIRGVKLLNCKTKVKPNKKFEGYLKLLSIIPVYL